MLGPPAQRDRPRCSIQPSSFTPPSRHSPELDGAHHCRDRRARRRDRQRCRLAAGRGL